MKPVHALVTYVTIFLVVMSLVNADISKSKSKGKKYDRTIKVNGKDLTRKAIVFDKDTPDVFYCIPNKPTGTDKIIVRARPIHKLCEFEGNLPDEDEYEPDCYKDVDESDYACKEKYRIMKRFSKEEEILNNTDVPISSR
ncbi:uncharacterized protein LOC129570217 isoform X2 [Sitodiplosis mosellana]|uniref:uncharacterized protein LOC129570217 isoform X2 n=1 Tax=Sitodiplosis mosellana TaxID=263140 RepID=UPI002444D2FE|nr:uncharacterized protein LOC129570217 isoform X2 [Sitodiplosis mosellana]